jgi:predicted nucleic acid-binding protein
VAKLFADAVFYIAMINRDDDFHREAMLLAEQTRNDRQFTTVLVLVEVCDYFCGRGEYFRQAALDLVRRVETNSRVTVFPLSDELWRAGLELYSRRLDKGYSVTDCVSMDVCQREGITNVLTGDHHFEQEGMRILL